MEPEKTLALMLRIVDFSETSCIVTMLTRDFGKVGAMAKGGRRPKGPFESALDLLSLCRVVLLRKSSGALDLLTEARLERRFRPADRDLGRLYAGYYVAELLLALTDENDPHPDLFDTAVETLGQLSAAPHVSAHVLRFELNCLRLLGFLPSLTQCAECSRPIEPASRVALGLLDGGVLCYACRPGKRQVISLSQEAWRLLVRLAEEEPFDVANLFETEESSENAPNRRVWGELRAVMNKYLSHHVGHELAMHRYLARSVPNRPATDKPTADKPAADKPANNQPTENHPATDKPANDNSATDNSTTDSPTGQT